MIRRALAAGHRPRSYLMAPRWLDDLADVVADADRDGVPVFVGEPAVLEALTGFHLHRGAIAAMHRPDLPAVEDVVRGARRVAVLEDVVDHTNVGAMFRSAAALGVDAVLVTPRCADPLYRRSVRVSMGTVFQVPWTRIDPWPQGMRRVAATTGSPSPSLALSDGPRCRWTSWRQTRRTGWRWCSAPRGTGSPRRRSRRPTWWCGSRWAGESTRSTWRRPAPSPSGRCARDQR